MWAWVAGWLRLRVSAMVCSARLSCRSPPRLRRWRVVRPEEAGIAGGAGEGGERGFAGGVCRVRPADQDLAGAGRADAGQLHQLGLDLGDQARDLAFEIVGFGGEDARSIEDLAHGANRMRPVRWRARLPAGDRAPHRASGELAGHFFALGVRPVGRTVQRGSQRGGDGVLPDCWLLAQWPPGCDGPTDYWLSDLPADTPLADLVHLAKSRWRVEHDYRELKPAWGWTTSRAAPGSAAPPRHPGRRPTVPDRTAADPPRSSGAHLSLYAVLRQLRYLLATWLGFCPCATNSSEPKQGTIGSPVRFRPGEFGWPPALAPSPIAWLSPRQPSATRALGRSVADRRCAATSGRAPAACGQPAVAPRGAGWRRPQIGNGRRPPSIVRGSRRAVRGRAPPNRGTHTRK